MTEFNESGSERRGHPGRGSHFDGRRGGPRGGQRGGRGRARRGDVRELVLAGLVDGPAHGYELIKRLEEATAGRWRPSPGSVYPMLQLLEDAGLTRSAEQDGRKVYELTDEGRAEADQARLTRLAADEPGPVDTLRDEVHQLHFAIKQIGTAGSPEQIEQAATALRDARKAIYRLLAE